MGFAWVTLATNDSYSLGALVLAHSLKRVGTKHDLAVLITPGVTEVMREKLSSVFSLVKEVNVLDSKDEANLALLARPELGITFTKLHCWRLTQYEKCVFIDADTLVVQNSDELFEREELSAAPDVGWPDCFNSGVFVFKPSQQTFASLTSHATSKGSFDGGDQGLLNSFFSDWAHKDISKHLPFIYNMCSTATYSYLPAFKQYGDDVKIIHFIGSTKPWLQYFDTVSGQVQPVSGTGYLQPLLQHWWDIFCENVHPQLSSVMAGIAGALAKITLGEARSSEQVALEEHMRKYGWEQGKIDFMGRDSFDNIWKKITTTLETSTSKSDQTLVKSKSAVTEEKIPTKLAQKPSEKETITITTQPKETTKTVSDEIPPQNQDVIVQEKEDKKFAVPVNEAKELSSTLKTSQLSSVVSEPILAIKTAPPVLSIKECGEKTSDIKTTQDQYSPVLESQDEPKTPIQGSIIPLGFTTPVEEASEALFSSTFKDLSLEPTKESELLGTTELKIKTDDEIKITAEAIDKTTGIISVDKEKTTVFELPKKIVPEEVQTLISDDAKDVKIPATPTIIEATPPTSPQFETTEEEIQAPKKAARKVIKKPQVNQDDEIVESTSDDKPTEVEISSTESSENLEPDTSVLETPPPTSINPPTPPKRKSRSAITKTTIKKSEQ